MQPPLVTASAWTLPQKILFRFAFCFILLWTIPFPFGYIPYVDKLESIAPWLIKGYYNFLGFFWQSWQKIADLVASDILRFTEPVFKGPSGSGDRTMIFLIVFSKLTIVVLATLVWSILDRKRASYNNLHYWTRVIMRYFLACTMFSYGFSKMFHLQMPFPMLSQLTMLFGDKSPMGLAWSFMGYSHGFSFYTGLGEVVGGLLLFWRRTSSLGALMLIAVMTTVAMMNFTYDIPVKLHSTLYVLFAIFLLIPDMKRIMNVLVWNKTAEPAVYPQMIHRPWMKRTGLILKYAFIFSIIISHIDNSIDWQKQFGDKRIKPPMYGIYNTEYVIRNRDTLPLLITDTATWKQIVVDYPGRAFIKTLNDTSRFYNFNVDTMASTVTVSPMYDQMQKSVLHYQLAPPYLNLKGIYKGDSVQIRLKRYDEKRFLLVRQEFRWVCEVPLNR